MQFEIRPFQQFQINQICIVYASAFVPDFFDHNFLCWSVVQADALTSCVKYIYVISHLDISASVLPWVFENLIVVCLVACLFWSYKFKLTIPLGVKQADYTVLDFWFRHLWLSTFLSPHYYFVASSGVVLNVCIWEIAILHLGYSGRPRFYYHVQSPPLQFYPAVLLKDLGKILYPSYFW